MIASILVKIVTSQDISILVDLLSNSYPSLSTILSVDSFREELLNLLSLLYAREFDERKVCETILNSRLCIHAVSIAIAVAPLLGRYYINTISTRLSKLFENFISSALDDRGLAAICSALGIRCEVSSLCLLEEDIAIDSMGGAVKRCYRYRVNVLDYLRYAYTLCSEPSWKLAFLALKEGYVYFENREKLVRLLTEAIKNLLLSMLTRVSKDRERVEYIISTLGLSPIVEDIKRKIVEDETQRVIREKPREAQGKVDKEVIDISSISTIEQLLQIAHKYFPPCIKTLLDQLLRGENLSHHQRFALATFLINIGIDLELILELFKHSPDFNEKIARYQIEHLAGLRGSRKKYLPYSCANMKALGLCEWDCGTRNPLAYFYKRVRVRKSDGENRNVMRNAG